jgi:hypothetical protein
VSVLPYNRRDLPQNRHRLYIKRKPYNQHTTKWHYKQPIEILAEDLVREMRGGDAANLSYPSELHPAVAGVMVDRGLDPFTGKKIYFDRKGKELFRTTEQRHFLSEKMDLSKPVIGAGKTVTRGRNIFQLDNLEALQAFHDSFFTKARPGKRGIARNIDYYRFFNVAIEQYGLTQNPLYKALTELSGLALERAPTTGLEQLRARGVSQRKIYGLLKQMNKQYKNSVGSLTNEQLFSTALAEMREYAPSAFGPDGPVDWFLHAPTAFSGTEFTKQIKAWKDALYGKYDIVAPGMAKPYQYSGVLRDVFDELLFDRDISERVAKRRVVGHADWWTGSTGRIKSLFAEAGYPIGEFTTEHIGGIASFLYDIGMRRDDLSGQLLYGDLARAFFPHLPQKIYGETAVSEGIKSLRGYKRFLEAGRYQPGIQDVLGRVLKDEERYWKYASQIERRLTGHFGTAKEYFPHRMARIYANQPIQLSRGAMGAFVGADFGLGSRLYEVAGIASDVLGKGGKIIKSNEGLFRIREKGIPSISVTISSLDDLLSLALKEDTKGADALRTLIETMTSAREQDLARVPKIMQRASLKTDMARTIAEKMLAYRGSPSGKKALANLQTRIGKWRGAEGLGFTATIEKAIEQITSLKVPWPVRDAITGGNMSHLLSALTEYDPRILEDPDYLDDVINNLNYAVSQAVYDIQATDGILKAGKINMEKRSEVGVRQFQDMIMRRYRDITGGQHEELLSSQLNNLLRVMEIERGKGLSPEDIGRVASAMEGLKQNEVTRQAFSALIAEYERDPSSINDILTSARAVYNPLRLDKRMSFDGEEGRAFYETIVGGKSAEEAVLGSMRDGLPVDLYRSRFESAYRSMIEERIDRDITREALGIERTGRMLTRNERKALKAWKKAHPELSRDRIRALAEGSYEADPASKLADTLNFMMEKNLARENRRRIREVRRINETKGVNLPLPQPLEREIFATAVDGGVHLEITNPRLAALMGKGLTGSMAIQYGGEDIIPDAVANRWVTASGKVLPFAVDPREMYFNAHAVINAGNIEDKAARIMAGLDNTVTLFRNLNMSTYHQSQKKFADIARDVNLIRQISSGKPFWVIDFETTGIPSAAQLAGEALTFGDRPVEIMQAAMRRYKIANGRLIEAGGGIERKFGISAGLAGYVQGLLEPYGLSSNQIVLSEQRDRLLQAIRDLRLVRKRESDAQLLEQTVLKFPDFFGYVGGEGTEGFARTLSRISAQDKEAIFLAHNAAGAEIPWSRLFFGDGIPTDRTLDTMTIFQLARTSGYPGRESLGFSQEDILYALRGAIQTHKAGADIRSLADIAAGELPRALSAIEGLEAYGPGDILVKHAGRGYGGRGSARFLGTETLGPGRYKAHFERLFDGSVYSLEAESQAGLQHQMSAFFMPATEEMARMADDIFLEDAARREISTIMRRPDYAMGWSRRMGLLDKATTISGVSVGDLTFGQFTEALQDEALGISSRRFDIMKRLSGWHDEVYGKYFADFYDTLAAAQQSGFVSHKEGRRIAYSFREAMKGALGEGLSLEREAMPWERALRLDIGGDSLTLSLASRQELERTLSSGARNIEDMRRYLLDKAKREGRAISGAQAQQIDGLREIALRLTGKDGFGLELSDFPGKKMSVAPLADVIWQAAQDPESKIYKASLKVQYEDWLNLGGRSDLVDVMAAAQEAGQRTFREVLGDNAEAIYKHSRDFAELIRSTPDSELLGATEKFFSELELERVYSGAAADVGDYVEREGTTFFSRARETVGRWMDNIGLDTGARKIAKGAAIAVGLMAAGSLVTSFIDNSPMPMDRKPRHDQAPATDGAYTEETGLGQRTLRVAPGGGYNFQNGLKFKVRATGSDIDSTSLGALMQEAINSTYPVNMNMNVTDNSNELDDRWYQERLAAALAR